MKRAGGIKTKKKQKSHSGGLVEASEKVSRAIADSPIGKAFGAADTASRMLKEGGLSTLAEKINLNDGMLRKAKRAVVRSIEDSSILQYFRRAVDIILNKPMRTYGLLFIFTALMGGGIFCMGYFGLLPIKYDLGMPICYTVMLLSAFPMLFSGRSLIETVNDSVFIGRFLKRNIAMDRQKLRGKGTTATNGFTCLMIAAVITVLSVFFPLWDMFIFLCKPAGVVFLMYNPECGLMLSLMLLPLVPESFVTAVLAITAVSFIIKVIRVKRKFSFDYSDIFVLMLFAYRFMLTAADGGKTLKFTYILFMFTYFLVKNLVLTKHQLSVAFSCIAFGAFAGSLLRLCEYWLTTSGMFPEIKAMISWDAMWRTDAFLDFCILALPACLAWVINKYSGWHIIGYAFMSAPIIACTVLNGSGNAWIAVTVSLFVYLILAYRTRLLFFVLGCVCIPAVCVSAYRFGALTIPVGSIYSDMLYRHGLMGIIAFIAVLFVLLQIMFRAKALSLSYEEFDGSINIGRYHGPVSAAGTIMICTALYGMASPLSSDACTLLFWAAAGIGGAACGIFEGRGVSIDGKAD